MTSFNMSQKAILVGVLITNQIITIIYITCNELYFVQFFHYITRVVLITTVIHTLVRRSGSGLRNTQTYMAKFVVFALEFRIWVLVPPHKALPLCHLQK